MSVSKTNAVRARVGRGRSSRMREREVLVRSAMVARGSPNGHESLSIGAANGPRPGGRARARLRCVTRGRSGGVEVTGSATKSARASTSTCSTPSASSHRAMISACQPSSSALPRRGARVGHPLTLNAQPAGPSSTAGVPVEPPKLLSEPDVPYPEGAHGDATAIRRFGSPSRTCIATKAGAAPRDGGRSAKDDGG